jgi:hypothetical protein
LFFNRPQTYEGPNPFEVPELLDPENEGVLIAPVEALRDLETVRRSKKRRDRAKSEAYRKTPWSLDEQTQNIAGRNPRYSAPPLSTASSTSGYMPEDDPFRKDPLSCSTVDPNLFFMEEEKRKVGATV